MTLIKHEMEKIYPFFTTVSMLLICLLKMAGALYSLLFIISMLFCNAFQISVKSDVWSLGCILYCMVYGHTPFQKVVRQYAKLMAIINPEYQINFPEIQDKKLLDVMKVCYSFCFVD